MSEHHKNGSTREQLLERILEVLEQMPEQLRQSFMLSHYQGLSPLQLGHRLRVDEATAKDLLRQANRLFLDKLHRYQAPDGSRA